MGLLSKLFGKKNQEPVKTTAEVKVYDVSNNDEKMNWAIEKAKLTLHYFEACLKSPKQGQRLFSIKVNIVEGKHSEHLWLSEPSFDDEGNLYGIVDNVPRNITSVKCNQKIGIERKFISDWMFAQDMRLIGGYTFRAIRENIPADSLAEFDENIGGIIVDDGEDYFNANFETPEGAILCLENAYDEDDIEKAMECKDFDIEARLFLKDIIKETTPIEIIEECTELCRLNYIKYFREHEMPKFKDVIRAFPKREKVTEKHMIITEVCYYPDGTISEQKLNTYYTDNGWRVLHPEN